MLHLVDGTVGGFYQRLIMLMSEMLQKCLNGTKIENAYLLRPYFFCPLRQTGEISLTSTRPRTRVLML